MGVMVYSLLWVTQDLYHQPKYKSLRLVSKPKPDTASRSAEAPANESVQVFY